MNAHLTSQHLHWNWMHEFSMKLEQAIHSTRVWQIVTIVAILSAIVLLLAFAEVFSSGSPQQSFQYYGYPSYPGYPVIP